MEFEIVDNTFGSTLFIGSRCSCSDCLEDYDLYKLLYEYRIYEYNRMYIWFVCKGCVARFNIIKYKKLQIRSTFDNRAFIAYIGEKNTNYVIEQYEKYALLQ